MFLIYTCRAPHTLIIGTYVCVRVCISLYVSLGPFTLSALSRHPIPGTHHTGTVLHTGVTLSALSGHPIPGTHHTGTVLHTGVTLSAISRHSIPGTHHTGTVLHTGATAAPESPDAWIWPDTPSFTKVPLEKSDT